MDMTPTPQADRATPIRGKLNSMGIDAEIDFQRRVWIAQRVGWVVIGILILTATLGLFGSGWLSRASAHGGGLRIEYERFARLQQPTKIRLVLSGQTPQVALHRRYFDSVQIEQITPEPSAVESAGEWLIYRFAGATPGAVILQLKPEEFGTLIGAAKLSGGNPLVFRQFVYP
jgi:hypothetical protein